MESNLDEYNSFYDRSKIHQLQARGEVKSQEDSLKITSCEIFLKAWVWKWVRYELYITSRYDSWLLELSNLMNMGQTASNPCTVDEISSKTRKNQLEFIWKIFTSRSQWNKSHWKCVLHNQDEKLVLCNSKNWEKFVKSSFTQESLSKSYFSKLLHVLITLKNFLERKIFIGKQNSWIQFQSSHFSHNCSNFHSTLLLLISNAQLHKWGLRGRKWGFI